MPQDARVSQRNSMMTPDFHGSYRKASCGQVDPAVPKETPLFHMVGVVVPRPVTRETPSSG